MSPRKVTLHGVHLWAHEPDEDGDYALAPPEHCDDEGHIVDLGVALFGLSYAHVFPPVIKQRNKVIGTEADLVEGWQ